MITYSLHRLWKEQKLVASNGEPLKDISSVRRRLKQFGFERTGRDKKGNKTYEIKEKDIKKMNKKNYANS